jgi:peptidoglycan/xylan/chitin deacetylase (PgdA/CDA1 family)
MAVAACGDDRGETGIRDEVTTSVVAQNGSQPAPMAVSPEEARARAVQTAVALRANELGRIPILMYHVIGRRGVSPARLRGDIDRLWAAGFYPTTVREMADGSMDIPAGKSPVILTFDDSCPTQYKILEDGSLDPDCAVAIMLAAAAEGGWAPKASFFPLLHLTPTAVNVLFGQPEYAQKKLRSLVAWGFEVGSHTCSHLDLSRATPYRIKEELADSESQLEDMIGGGYRIYTLCPPRGRFPDDRSLLTSGMHQGESRVSYAYEAVVRNGGGYSYSPFSTEFDPLYIPRAGADRSGTVADLVRYFKQHPELRFVSDGDAGVVSAPARTAARLGTVRPSLASKMVVLY